MYGKNYLPKMINNYKYYNGAKYTLNMTKTASFLNFSTQDIIYTNFTFTPTSNANTFSSNLPLLSWEEYYVLSANYCVSTTYVLKWNATNSCCYKLYYLYSISLQATYNPNNNMWSVNYSYSTLRNGMLIPYYVDELSTTYISIVSTKNPNIIFANTDFNVPEHLFKRRLIVFLVLFIITLVIVVGLINCNGKLTKQHKFVDLDTALLQANNPYQTHRSN